jgi:catechol 1,2-dioxygenase
LFKLNANGDVADREVRHGRGGETRASEQWICHVSCQFVVNATVGKSGTVPAIRTDAEGRYSFRSVVPVGYSVPGSKTEQLLDLLGRHGHRPAHVHSLVSAPGYRKLTTQINVEDDPHLWDDFAFATREGLIPKIGQAEGAESRTASMACSR